MTHCSTAMRGRRHRFLELAAQAEKLSSCDRRLEFRESSLEIATSWLQLAAAEPPYKIADADRGDD